MAHSDDAAASRKLVNHCLAHQASISSDLKRRAVHFKLDEVFTRTDRRWEELRDLGAAPGAWPQAQCAAIVESCIKDLASLAVAMNKLNEFVWGGQQVSMRGALDECTAITGAAGLQLILVSAIALKVANDTGASLSSSVTHARYDFDTICNVGTACIRAYLDRAYPEPRTLGTRQGSCCIGCQDPDANEYFTSEEVPAEPSDPAFAAAMGAANAARRKKVSSETDEHVADAGLASMWTAARSLYERRGPRRVAPREP